MGMILTVLCTIVFEDDGRAEKTAEAVENEIHHDESVSDEKVATTAATKETI
jgi:hypothetical protein